MTRAGSVDTHLRLDVRLVDAARQGAGLDHGTGVPVLVRLALAVLAGWPKDAARLAAGLPATSNGQAELCPRAAPHPPRETPG